MIEAVVTRGSIGSQLGDLKLFLSELLAVYSNLCGQ